MMIDKERENCKKGGSIPQEDFDRFVKPYESGKILAEMRKELS